MGLPQVRPCNGGCGTWLDADVPPAAESVGPVGSTPVYLCTNCTRKLPGSAVIETKVVDLGGGLAIEAPVYAKRGPGRPRKVR